VKLEGIELKENERVDDLQYKGLRLIQKKTGFCFGVDAVLLANFADVRKNDRVLDIGCGTGIIALLAAAKKSPSCVIGLEIQDEMAEMAARSVQLNKMEHIIKIVRGDIKNSVELFGASTFDSIVTNPPYMNKGGGLVNPSDSKAISRHELLCTLEDVIHASSRLLIPNGRFSMVHRPDRLADIISLMRKYSIEPKQMRFVHPTPYKSPNLLLIGGIRGGKPLLKISDPLYVYDENGKYSKEINDIYCRNEVGIS